MVRTLVCASGLGAELWLALHFYFVYAIFVHWGSASMQAAEDAEQLKWVYVRVKRAKATYFLHVDLQQTTFEVKAMLQDLTQRVACSSPFHANLCSHFASQASMCCKL